MLVGRDQELGTLADALKERIPTLLVGPAGMGKTTMLREATAQLDPPPKVGGGLALLNWMAYLPIARALRRELPATEAPAVAAFIAENLAGSALVLDDLQWVDSETLGLLSSLAGRVPFLAAVRLGEDGTARAREVACAAGFVDLELSALRPDEAVTLVSNLRPDLAPEAVQRVVERARGNPLLLEELSAGDSPHDAVLLSLTARLPPRSEPAWNALERLALLHRPAARELLGDGVEDLLAAGLATTEGAEIRLRHDLLGEAALETMDADRRRTVHAALAEMLPDAGEAARHHAAAGQLPEARDQALAAAERSSRTWDRAHHLSLAARCTDDGAGDGLRLRAATELVGVGEAAAALQILQAVRAEDPPTLAELELVTARAWIFLGKREEAWRHLTAGLAMADATVLGLRAKLLAEKSRLLAFDNEGPASVRVAREALDLAGRAGDGHEASLRMVLATALYMTADPECIDHCRAALLDARRRGDTALESEALEALVAFISGFDDVSGSSGARNHGNRPRPRPRHTKPHGPHVPTPGVAPAGDRRARRRDQGVPGASRGAPLARLSRASHEVSAWALLWRTSESSARPMSW